MRLLHLADTHIKNLKHHDEYAQIFNEIYRIAREQRVDLIIHCGDIAHTKTQISPEFVDMASEFFKNLASIAPTHVILGNHDVNLKNDSRQDSISPIIKALNLSNLFLHKYSGEISINDQFSLNVLSIIDEDKWVKPSNAEKINIGLYHGAISGITTDTGYQLESDVHLVDVYEGHDYVFLGDIHKTNQSVDKEGKVRYPGSTVQQGFAETDDKGFLIWDIKGKNDFTCEHHAIKNPKPYINIVLDDEGNVPEYDIVISARVRIIADKSVSLDKVKKATEIVKNKFQPESVTFVNKANVNKNSQTASAITHEDNLRDLGFQEKLIREYLKDYKADEEIIVKVIELNKKFSSAIEEGEETYRNINWKLKSLEWDNLFNYGEGNKIDFASMNGIVGIFGKNYTGKSSVVDSLLYTVYNTTSKNNRKNLNVINQNAEGGFGKAIIDINGEEYVIDRKTEKYLKKSKGVEVIEGKTDVQFTTDSESLNGLARNDTDKNIRRFFGTVDDFFLTSMASQFGYLSFITEGSTNRKQILAKFLDLETFEKKFKLAKEESSELKALLKKLEGVNYEKDISNAQEEIEKIEIELEQKKIVVDDLKEKISTLNQSMAELQLSINNMPTDIIDYDNTKENLNKHISRKEQLILSNKNMLEDNVKKTSLLDELSKLLSLIDIEELSKKKEELDLLNNQINSFEKKYDSLNNDVSNRNKRIKLLNEIPCGDSFPNCKFIKDAFTAKENYENIVEQLTEAQRILTDKTTEKSSLEEEVTASSKRLNTFTAKVANLKQDIAANELNIEKNNSALHIIDSSIQTLEEKLRKYEENKQKIQNYQDLLGKKANKNKILSNLNDELRVAERDLLELYKNHGSITQKYEISVKQKEELEKIRRDYAAYDLFQACMHPNGLSYEIIKSKLPEINQEIAKILSNIVDFSIYLENDDDKLDIMIKHPKYDARPLEMGSGAEKTLASTAIRLALISVTTLPRPDFFIMDEPGTALDAENLEGFVRILELIKSYFKTVILISHLDSLKDCVDSQIVIDRKDGYAYIYQ
jgi:DNA repair exonuclease SbcCD ATPase subunit/DNA repair exonuclease SbcCD nuclease subunit